MTKKLFCSAPENSAAKFVQGLGDGIVPLSCRRTSIITPIYGKSSITRCYSESVSFIHSHNLGGDCSEGCPMDFETAFAYARASTAFGSGGPNLFSMRDAKGKEYCQRFAVQF